VLYENRVKVRDHDKILKQRTEWIKEFFAAEKKKNLDLFTIEEMYFSFQHFSSFMASLYNKICSKMFTSIIEGNGKINPYTLINEVLKFPLFIGKKQYDINSMIVGNGFSDFVSGLDRKIKSNFSTRYIKDFLIGKKSIPNATNGFPIPFYKHTSHGIIVSFQGVDYEHEKLVYGEGDFDDYVVNIRIPIVHPSELRKNKKKQEETSNKINFLDEIKSIEFKDIPFLIHSGYLLRKTRDGSTNALILDFITGKIKERIHNFVKDNESRIAEFIKSKEFKKKGELADINEIIESGIEKWSGISSYEILPREIKRSGRKEWFVNFSYQNLPRVVTSRSGSRIAGVDFCFSRKKILSVVIIDIDVMNKEREKIQSWIVDEMPIFDSVYHLRKIYDKFKSSLSNLQRSGKKSRKTATSMSKVQKTFENKRKYFINKITKDIAKMCNDQNVSEVHVENLDNLRQKDTWFAINKIRSFPVKGMIDLLERKLDDLGIKTVRVSPKNTSRTCPVCGTLNDDFTFEYRSKNKFPIFTCKDKKCRYSKEKTNLMEKHYRDADLNAAINIAIKNDDNQ